MCLGLLQLECHIGLWDIVMVTSCYFLTFYRQLFVLNCKNNVTIVKVVSSISLFYDMKFNLMSIFMKPPKYNFCACALRFPNPKFFPLLTVFFVKLGTTEQPYIKTIKTQLKSPQTRRRTPASPLLHSLIHCLSDCFLGRAV